MKMRNNRPMSPKRRHAQINLPPLDPGQAVMVASILDEALHAIWNAHGDAMVDYLEGMAWAFEPDEGNDLDF